ncbi:ABC-2 family transporter protein [Pseudomonas sp. MSSRFD41]|uniref:ABC transporter permease n=1 Tax=unclassified Pseudomonas TaxID=196821 RepID=UPI00163B24C7|nr:ABC-2 family transporter protein [Pseudomonas sp. MSSRFD41]MBC2656608.1 ABC-2 family transporter protein [Pseudomonas sp. MSSRFD41]
MSRPFLKVAGVARTAIRRKVAHRAELFVLVLASLVPLFMMVIWMGIAKDAALEGFTPAKFAAYFALVFLIGEIVSSTAAEEVENDIHSGDIGSFLLKPFNIGLYYFLSELASALVRVIPIFFLVAGVFLFSQAGNYVKLAYLLPALLGIALGFAINYLLYFIGGLAAFWSDQASSFDLVLTYMLTLFGGVLAPLSLYPGWMQSILQWSPFPYIINFPIKIIMGELSHQQLLNGLMFQLALVLFLSLLARLIWSRGVRHYSVFG